MKNIAIILVLATTLGGCQSVLIPALESYRDDIALVAADQSEELILRASVDDLMLTIQDAIPFAAALREKIYFLVKRYIDKIINKLKDR